MIEDTAEAASVDKKRAKASKDEVVRRMILGQLMSTAEGRRYLYLELEGFNVFAQSEAVIHSHAALAFFEGRRSQGVKLLATLSADFPEQFVLMLKEAHPKELKNERSEPELDA